MVLHSNAQYIYIYLLLVGCMRAQREILKGLGASGYLWSDRAKVSAVESWGVQMYLTAFVFFFFSVCVTLGL